MHTAKGHTNQMESNASLKKWRQARDCYKIKWTESTVRDVADQEQPEQFGPTVMSTLAIGRVNPRQE